MNRIPKGTFVGVYLTHEELTGNRATISDLSKLLSALPQKYVLKWLAWLGTNLAPGLLSDGRNQLGIAQQILPDDLFEIVRRRWSDGSEHPEALFHKQQTWLILQLAVIACQSDVEGFDEKQAIKTFGLCLLYANDVLASVENARHSQVTSLADGEWMVSTFLPLIELNAHAVGPVDPTRAYAIWCKALKDPAVQNSVRKILPNEPLEECFCRHYGVTLTRFVEILAVIHLLLLDQNEQFLPKLIGPHALKAICTVEEANAVFNVVARTPEELAEAIVFGPRQSWATDFFPLRQYPLIKFSENQYACPDVHLLESYFENMIYWRVVETVDNDHNLVSQLYGLLFEHHLHQVVREFAYGGLILARQSYPSPKFVSDQAEVCDCFIDWHEVIVMCEFKSNRLTRHQKYSGSAEVLLSAVDDVYAKDSRKGAKGVAQLARSTRRILDGDAFRSSDSNSKRIDVDNAKSIIPILVISEPGLSAEYVRSRLDARFRDLLEAKPSDSIRVSPLVVLTHYQLENIEHYTNRMAAKEIFLRYIAQIESRSIPPLDNFSSFVHELMTVPNNVESTYMNNMRREQLESIYSQRSDESDSA